MKLAITTIILICIVQIGCKSPARNLVENPSSYNAKHIQIIDSILLDPSKYPKNNDSIISVFASILGIKKIRADSNAISIKILCELIDTINLVSLEINGNRCIASVYSFGFSKSGTKEYLNLFEKYESVNPASGCQKLIDSIRFFRIFEIPNQSDLAYKKEIFVEGGDVFTFEVSNKGTSKVFKYIEPGAYKNQNWQSMNVYRMLRLIERELGISTYSRGSM